jgi:putative dehydrogenase
MASPVFRVRRQPGDGARTKLVNNLLAAINLAGAAEALGAGRKAWDWTRRLTLAVIERSSGQSWIGSDRLNRALAQATAPLAHLALLTKDSALAIAAAAEVDCELPRSAGRRCRPSPTQLLLAWRRPTTRCCGAGCSTRRPQRP